MCFPFFLPSCHTSMFSFLFLLPLGRHSSLIPFLGRYSSHFLSSILMLCCLSGCYLVVMRLLLTYFHQTSSLSPGNKAHTIICSLTKCNIHVVINDRTFFTIDWKIFKRTTWKTVATKQPPWHTTTTQYMCCCCYRCWCTVSLLLNWSDAIKYGYPRTLPAACLPWATKLLSLAFICESQGSALDGKVCIGHHQIKVKMDVV